MGWLLPLVLAVIACVGMFISRPEKPWVAAVAVVLTLLAGGTQALMELSHSELESKIEGDAEFRLRLATNRFVGLLKSLAMESDPNWLPAGPDEFFGPEMSDVACALDAAAEAPALPKRRWDVFVSQRSRDFEERLDGVLFNLGYAMDDELFEVVASVRHSSALSAWILIAEGNRVQRGLRAEPGRVQSLCRGLEPLVTEMLAEVGKLYSFLSDSPNNVGAKKLKAPWDEMERSHKRSESTPHR